MVEKTIEGPYSQNGYVRPVPFLAKVAGVWDERTYHSDEIGSEGRRHLAVIGWQKLALPAVIATGVAMASLFTVGWIGVCFALTFFALNAMGQSIVNPMISERRVNGLSTWFHVTVSYFLLLASSTFAITIVAWFLFKPTVDSQHSNVVASVMPTSQERKNLTYAEDALKNERTILSSKRQVSTSAVESAQTAYTKAQDALVSANATYQNELSKGGGGRKPGDGTIAKALWEALKVARAAEADAKKALDEARAQAGTDSSESPELVAAYNAAKERYEAKQKDLIDRGPSMLDTFWWLAEKLHTQPALILVVLFWAFLEAFSIISHSIVGTNSYERARFANIEQDHEWKEIAHQRLVGRVEQHAVNKANLVAARRAAAATIRQARDRSKS